jgi:hypothetical protein
VRLLEEAWRQLGTAESALRARLLGSLARALLYAGLQQQAAVYAEQAVAMARRVGDPTALAFNLDVMLDVPRGPEQTEARLANATEMLRLAEAAGDKELIAHAYSRLCCTGWRWGISSRQTLPSQPTPRSQKRYGNPSSSGLQEDYRLCGRC